MTTSKRRAALVTFTCLAAIVACDNFGITGPGYFQECRVDYDSSWPSNPPLGKVYIAKPAHCPVTILAPLTQIDYSATAEIRTGRWARRVESEFLDDDRQVTFYYVDPAYTFASNQGSDTLDVVNIDGYYRAGQAMEHTEPGTDYGVHRVLAWDLSWYVAEAILRYEYGAPSLSISGPIEVLPSESFTLRGWTNDPEMVSPISYRWRRNGTTVSTTDRVTWPESSPGEVHDFEFRMTDATGYSHVATHRVQTKTCDWEGCNDW